MTVTVIGENTGDDYTGTEDGYLDQGAPTTNRGNNSTGKVQRIASTHRNVIVRFTGLSNISSSEIVSAATIGFYKFSASGEINVDVSRVLRDWVVDQFTWNIWKSSNSWATAGGEGAGDISATKTINAQVVSGTGVYATFSSAQMVTDIQNWVDLTNSNEGHLFYSGDADSADYTNFGMENWGDGQRPYLSVTHAAGGGFQAAWAMKRSGMIGAR